MVRAHGPSLKDGWGSSQSKSSQSKSSRNKSSQNKSSQSHSSQSHLLKFHCFSGTGAHTCCPPSRLTNKPKSAKPTEQTMVVILTADEILRKGLGLVGFDYSRLTAKKRTTLPRALRIRSRRVCADLGRSSTYKNSRGSY